MSYRKHLMPSDISPSVAYGATAVDSDSDTISRQTAQRLFGKALTYKEQIGKLTWTTSEVKQWLADCIEQLPPAQPDVPDINVGDKDTISRKAAIEAIEAEKIAHGQYLTSSYVGYEFAEDAIRKLPPAQPEIIRCKDCKYGILDCDFPHERYCDFKGNEWNNDDHFCGHAKRREVKE